MARVGRFGRRRSGGQNLTMLIVNLIREQRQAEDRAAFDAWQNGGMFKGKPMTDERLLGYIKQRRDGFSTDDPLWDEWNNQLIQTRFGIGEQKITTAFKQGKVSAGAVAKWYRGQLDSIPKNSAFYRTVAGRAGDWAKSAAGSARAAGRAAAYKAAKAKIDRIYASINRNNALIDAVTRQAIRAGVLNPGETLTTGDASDIEAWLANGVSVGGRPVTYADLQRTAVKNFNAIGALVPIYKQQDWSVKGLLDDRKQALDGVRALNAVDDRSKYEAAHDQWEQRLAEAGNDPYAIETANAEYADALSGIYADASATKGKQENADVFLSALQGEINALNGDGSGVTVASLFGQAPNDDAAETAASVEQNTANVDALREGTAYFGQTKPGGEWSVVSDPNLDRNLNPSLQKAVVRIGGMARVVFLTGKEVHGGVLQKNGVTISLSETTAPIADYLADGYSVVDTPEVVGYQYDSPTGQRSWGVYNDNGDLRFTQDNPFAGDSFGGPNDSVIVLGDTTGEDGAPVTDFLDPKVAIDKFSPLPLSMNVTPAEVKAAMGSTLDPGDEYKAAEYADFVRETKDAKFGQSRPYSVAPTRSDGQQQRAPLSPMSAAVNDTLTGIQSQVGSLFVPSVNAQTGFTVPTGTAPTATARETGPSQAARSQPSRFATPFPAPKPPPVVKPPKPPKETTPFYTPPNARTQRRPRKRRKQQTYRAPSGNFYL